MTLRMSNTNGKAYTIPAPSNPSLSLNVPEEYATSISMEDASAEQLSLFDNVTLGIQESTMQVPCGDYSILDPFMKVPAFNQAVYLIYELEISMGIWYYACHIQQHYCQRVLV